MNPNFLAFIHKSITDIEYIMEQGSKQNYGNMSDKLKNMYLEMCTLRTVMDGHLDEMSKEKVVIDATDGLLDEN